MVASGESVQVLSVEANGRYRCSEETLERVAGGAGGAARGLPVAVVSVAGATRGGKSFLLDFFLRYLSATEEARRSGEWLGAEDQPLTGFSWRGGCDRHTEGILMWSDPIVVNLGSGQKKKKMAVVLLDTQGSFDSYSTVRDSSTVFALSTLLASVQIYNISQNIKEDDLQHLQLFTEYGKLARDKDEAKPFQELRFLVRDWCWAYQHPVGAEGGQQLLDKKLEIHKEQAPELREVREAVRGAFERVRGFLLPHPGLQAATNPGFTGCLKDISSEFKEALLELVPSLFGPEHLTVKQINGQRMTLQGFVEYFKAYVKIFNSDILPTPTTIMQATSSASMELALIACREKYISCMGRAARGAACLPRDMLLRHHAAALAAAREAFAARRTLGAVEVVNARLEALLQELEISLADRIAINNGNILETAARCKTVYEDAMQTDNCLITEHLMARHTTALNTARHTFQKAFAAPIYCDDRDCDSNDDDKGESQSCDEGDDKGASGSDSDDGEEELKSCDEKYDDYSENGEEGIEEDWEALRKDLEELLPLHRERNTERIAAAASQAHELYLRLMREGLSVASCLHPRSFHSLHVETTEAATECFQNCWLNGVVSKEHETELNTYLRQRYAEFLDTNKENNERAVEETISVYQNIMTDIFNGGRCLHPKDLDAQHNRAQASATARFHEHRDPGSRDKPLDAHQRDLNQSLLLRYQTFTRRNESLNQEAIEEALQLYNAIIPKDINVHSKHETVKATALQHFNSKRRPARAYFEDIHLEELTKKIEESYKWISTKSTLGIIGAGALALVGGLLLRR